MDKEKIVKGGLLTLLLGAASIQYLKNFFLGKPPSKIRKALIATGIGLALVNYKFGDDLSSLYQTYLDNRDEVRTQLIADLKQENHYLKVDLSNRSLAQFNCDFEEKQRPDYWLVAGSNDTFRSIAKKYYGDAAFAQDLREANNVDRLVLGYPVKMVPGLKTSVGLRNDQRPQNYVRVSTRFPRSIDSLLKSKVPNYNVHMRRQILDYNSHKGNSINSNFRGNFPFQKTQRKVYLPWD